MKVSAVDVATAGTAGASFHGRGAETSRLVIDDERRVVVGATFVGPDVGELLHAATIALVDEVPVERLFEAVPAFSRRGTRSGSTSYRPTACRHAPGAPPPRVAQVVSLGFTR